MENHTKQHQWFALINPNSEDFASVSAYMKISGSVYGATDTPVELKMDDNDDVNGSSGENEGEDVTEICSEYTMQQASAEGAGVINSQLGDVVGVNTRIIQVWYFMDNFYLWRSIYLACYLSVKVQKFNQALENAYEEA